MPKPLHLLRQLVYWGLPPLILLLILRRLDLTELVQLATRLSPWALCAALALVFVKVGSGALRWHGLAQHFACSGLPLKRDAAEYWASLAVGTVVPGTLGSDAYRVALGGRRTQRYFAAACAVIIEKGVAVLSCAVLVAALLPLLGLGALPSAWVPRRTDLTTAVWAVAGLGCVALLMFVTTSIWRDPVQRSLARLQAAVDRRLRALAAKATGCDAPTGADLADRATAVAAATPTTSGGLLVAALAPRMWLPALGLSVMIHAAAALQAQLLLQAMGHELPYAVHLLIAPLAILAASLPITVAGLGMREAVYVVCYGVFGVPAGPALLMGLFLFAVTLGVQAAGAFLIQRPGRAAAPPRTPAGTLAGTLADAPSGNVREGA